MAKRPKFGIVTKPKRDKPRKRPGRHKKRRYAVTFKKGRFVMFPSYLRHSITQNKNKKPFVGLSMRWQNAYPGE